MCNSVEPQASGFTIIEMMVVLAVIAIVTAIAVPSTDAWFARQRLSGAARSVEAAFSYARSEAGRSGNIHLVLFQTDAQGNAPLLDADGAEVDILVVDDGLPGSAGQNCSIDGGEALQGFPRVADVSFGFSGATAAVPIDAGAGSMASGTTFTDAEGDPASWVLFRPEGPSVAFSHDCATGAMGSGGGAVYLTDGARDVAVVLTPLGASRLHAWSGAGGGTWSD